MYQAFHVLTNAESRTKYLGIVGERMSIDVHGLLKKMETIGMQCGLHGDSVGFNDRSNDRFAWKWAVQREVFKVKVYL